MNNEHIIKRINDLNNLEKLDKDQQKTLQRLLEKLGETTNQAVETTKEVKPPTIKEKKIKLDPIGGVKPHFKG